jgi:bacteriorhodopsin
MSFLGKRSNTAVAVNRKNLTVAPLHPLHISNSHSAPSLQGTLADIHITQHGSDWLWAAFAIFSTATIVFLVLGHRKPATDRIFHYITAGITMVAAIAYFSLASDLGFAPIPVEFVRSNPRVAGMVRQVFYVRYIDW